MEIIKGVINFVEKSDMAEGPENWDKLQTWCIISNIFRELCETIHSYGGQVYLDGANMNAMVSNSLIFQSFVIRIKVIAS